MCGATERAVEGCAGGVRAVAGRCCGAAAFYRAPLRQKPTVFGFAPRRSSIERHLRGLGKVHESSAVVTVGTVP